MEQNEQEIIFQSSDEALQMLADVTGKKIMIPDKAEPTVASRKGRNIFYDVHPEFKRSSDDSEEDVKTEDNDSEIAEDSTGIVKDIDQKIEGLTKIKTQVQDAMSQVKDITG